MAEEAPTRRRWFQFGLRTVFGVVTVLAAFLAYHANWIRQRHALLDERVRPFTDHYVSSVTRSQPFWTASGHERAPGLLWIFGEPGTRVLMLYVIFHHHHDETPEGKTECDSMVNQELARAKALFPEANVQRGTYELVP